MSTEQLIAIFEELIQQYGIKVIINPDTIPSDTLVALDVEHDEQGAFVGCGIYFPSVNTVYYYSDIISLNDINFHPLSIVAHNGKGDLELLRQWGCDIKDSQLIWDTMLIGHIIDSSTKGYGLKGMSKRELGIEYPSYDDIVGKKTKKQSKERQTLDKQPEQLVAMYNAMDTYVTYKLYKYQVNLYTDQITQNRITEYFKTIEQPVSLILRDMENRGMCNDLTYLEGLKDTLAARLDILAAKIKNELGCINLASPKQLLDALHAKDIYPELKGKPSTDKRALASVGNIGVINALLQYSELDTLLSSFVYPYLERGQEVIHPFFNQTGTRTGRLSCSNPNLLQIPRKTDNGKLVRRMFIPRPGMLMGDCDFGQIEPRLMAHLSKDPVLCKMFNDGVDFHTFTAERMGISRERAKVLNLSVGYRATFKSVQAQLGGTREEAQEQINSWWNLFPNLRRWQDTLIYDSKRSGFCTTLLGRRIRVDGLSDGNVWKREAAERQLINNITQGSAAEVMKMAMIKIADTSFSSGFGLLVQVYDELLFESGSIEIDSKKVKNCMENALKLDVPLTVDCKIGDSWASCH